MSLISRQDLHCHSLDVDEWTTLLLHCCASLLHFIQLIPTAHDTSNSKDM